MDSVERFFQACQGRDPLHVELSSQGGGSSIGLEFEKPFLLVGRAPGADFGVADEGTALRQLYLQLIGGRLFALQLSEEVPTRIGEEHWRAGWVSSEDRFDIGEAILHITNPVQPGAPPSAVIDPTASTPSGRVLFSLECGLGSSRIRRVDNARQILLIGRSAPAKLRIKDRTLCPIHAAIVTLPTSTWLIDLSFEGGVTVNDEVVPFAEIQPGDVFTCGRVPFRILSTQDNLGPRRNVTRVEVTPPGQLKPLDTSLAYAPPVRSTPVIPDDRMTPVLEELSRFQAHSFQQCQQILNTVMQMVGVVLSDQRAFVKDELDRMERIMMTMAAGQPAQRPALPPAEAPTVAQLLGQATEPTRPVSPPAPPAVGYSEPPRRPASPPPPQAPIPPATPGMNDLVLHSWVEQQLQSLQTEQESLWQRVKRAISGDAPTAT